MDPMAIFVLTGLSGPLLRLSPLGVLFVQLLLAVKNLLNVHLMSLTCNGVLMENLSKQLVTSF